MKRSMKFTDVQMKLWKIKQLWRAAIEWESIRIIKVHSFIENTFTYTFTYKSQSMKSLAGVYIHYLNYQKIVLKHTICPWITPNSIEIFF